MFLSSCACGHALTVYEQMQASFVLTLMMIKVVVFLVILIFMLKFLLDAVLGKTTPNYYVISALLYMRSSLESQLNDDWSSCRQKCSMLVLETILLLEKTHAYVCMGILFESAGLARMLQKVVWTDVDEVHGRAIASPWKLSFVVTLVYDYAANSWHMSCGLLLWPCLKAWFLGRPWCVAYFTPSVGKSPEEDKWYTPAEFELWSSRQNHMRMLLESARDLASSDHAERALHAPFLVRTNSRSVEVVQ